MAVLREHQKMMLEMLNEVDCICKKNNIKYMLFSGTLLGAVRHQGFIPWDDDLDIVIMRPEYERFLEIAPLELDKKKYYLQKEFTEHWPMFFSKLRRNNTACIERYIPKDTETHLGVYIDIFPCDNLADNFAKRRFQFFASKIVIAKALDARGYLTKNYVKKLFILLCRMIPEESMRRIVKREKDRQSAWVHVFFGASSRYQKSIFPREWLSCVTKGTFEKGEYPISVHSSEILTVMYGNYLTPTPPSQRGKKVHAEIVDLEHSYKKYLGIQKKMTFREHSRSIR